MVRYLLRRYATYVVRSNLTLKGNDKLACHIIEWPKQNGFHCINSIYVFFNPKWSPEIFLLATVQPLEKKNQTIPISGGSAPYSPVQPIIQVFFFCEWTCWKVFFTQKCKHVGDKKARSSLFIISWINVILFSTKTTWKVTFNVIYFPLCVWIARCVIKNE